MTYKFKIPPEILLAMQNEYERQYETCHIRFYSYIGYVEGELAEITVGCKMPRRKDGTRVFKYRAVLIKTERSRYVKDLYHSYMGGYQVKFTEKETWGWIDVCQSEALNIWSKCVNWQIVMDIPEFKYCAYDKYHGHGEKGVIEYIKLYRTHPQIELLAKAGLYRVIDSKNLLNECEKDKQFLKWYVKHQNFTIPVNTLIWMYRTNSTVEDAKKRVKAQEFKTEMTKRYGKCAVHYDANKVERYCLQNQIGYALYFDYLNACKELQMDMNDTKNLYPAKNFMYWHDLRIRQVSSERAKKDARLREEFIQMFSEVSSKYESVQGTVNGLVVMIAKSPNELVVEGVALKQCVGQMGYDKKMAEEKSLILFVRKPEELDTPYVTVEYNLETNNITQKYGKNDSKPSDDVIDALCIWEQTAKTKIAAIRRKAKAVAKAA